MSKDVNWADECIQKAQKTHPTSESVANRVKELLTGRLSERPLRSSELADITKALIADITPPSTSTTVKKT